MSNKSYLSLLIKSWLSVITYLYMMCPLQCISNINDAFVVHLFWTKFKIIFAYIFMIIFFLFVKNHNRKNEVHIAEDESDIAHKDTPFCHEPNGSVNWTLKLLSVLRLLFPKVLLPATTALGTADVMGREKEILAGANVRMPNLSPVNVREKYLLYDGKICTGEEAAECNVCLKNRVERIGYHVADSRGDHPDFVK